MLSCRMLGHRFRFSTQGERMLWECERGCGTRGALLYPSAAQAERCARAYDRDDRPEGGWLGALLQLVRRRGEGSPRGRREGLRADRAR